MATTGTPTRTAERETFLADIIITAAEGGIGYWADVQAYRWCCPDLDGGTADPAPNGGSNAYVTLYDMDTDRDYTIDLDVVDKALTRIRGNEPIPYLSEPTRQLIRACDRLNDTVPGGGDIDANVADQILQVAAFGRVVYG